MITEEKVREITERILTGTDNFLVDLKVNPGSSIVVEVDNDKAISVDELARLNRSIRESLGTEAEDLELRVSSPGTNRPFRVERQFEKHIGRLVQIELNDGRKSVGVLESWNKNETGLRIQTPSKVKGRPAKLDKEITVVGNNDIKSTKAIVSFK